MLFLLKYAPILVFGCFFALAEEPTESLMKLDSVYKMEPIEISDDEKSPTGSFVGKAFDEELLGEDLKKNQIGNVDELVSQVPGADNLGGPRKEAQGINIRGFQSKQVLLLLDGTRSNFSMTHNSVIPIRTHLLKRVDVLKGGASSRFGNGALGGLVSFTTQEAHDVVRDGNSFGASIRGQYFDASASQQSSLTAAQLFGRRKQFGLMVDDTTTTAKDIRLSDKKALAYSGFEDSSLWAKGNWKGRGGHGLWFSAEEQNKSSLTPFNPALEELDPVGIADQREKYQSFKMQYSRKGKARFRPEVLVYQSKTDMVREQLSVGRIDNREVKTSGLSLHNNVDVVVPSQSRPWSVRLQPGAELVRDDNQGDRDGGPLSNFPNGRAEHIGAYILADVAYQETWWAQAGMRYDEVHLQTNSSVLEDRINKAWSPEVELGKQMTDNWSAAVSYEEGYNAPKIQDIYVDGPHFPGPFGYNNFIPNENLSPEDSKTVEVRTTYDYGDEDYGGSFQWSEYESTIDNYIEQEIDFFGNTTQFVNRPQVKLQGREFSWKQNIDRVQLGVTYARVRSIKSSNGLPLSTSPADQIRMLYGYERTQWFLGFENIIYKRQDRVDSTVLGAQQSTPGSNVQNALLGYKFNRSDYFGVARLKLNNIFDREYQKHGSPLKEPARDVRLEVVFSL